MFIALLLVQLQALPNDQQTHLPPNGFNESLAACMDALDQSEKFCGCVLRGFELFMTKDDWYRLLHQEPLRDSNKVEQIELSCKRAAE